jgi:pimeloyl-ACP methyl ester carboxylesterase
VLLVMVVVPACGFLTVPELHDEPDEKTIGIFVIRIEPTEGVTAGDSMVVVGETLGARIEYGGLVQLAQRTGRTVYVVDRRGTGLSEPRLECPEVTTAAHTILALPTRDADAAAAVDAAVRACRSRLTDAGIDVAAYGLRESALDIEALRAALGLEPWNVIGFGSASRLALEVGRLAPAGVRAMVLDSPVLPNGPDPMFAAEAADHAIGQLAQVCAAEPACAASHPDAAADLQRAVDALDEHPASFEVELTPGQPGTVIVDGVRFGRAARNMLAFSGGAEVDLLLASVTAAVGGSLTAEDPVVQLLVRADPLCLGYVPNCEGIEHGSLLATVCGDILPFVDGDAMLAAGKDVPGMAGVFETNPFFTACDAWQVPPDPRVGDPIATDIPILAMVGQFDPFTGPTPLLEAAAAGLSRALFLEVPNHSYNIFGFHECPRLVRREWLDDLDGIPATDCFAEIQVVQLSP